MDAHAGPTGLVRLLEFVYLCTHMLLPALGSAGLLLVYDEMMIGKLLMFGWLPILVLQLFEFAYHEAPDSLGSALFMALAVPGELALTHVLFGDTPMLFFTDMFLVEVVGLLIALPLLGVAKLFREGADGEGVGAVIVLTCIGVPLIVWVVVPFWTSRSDDAWWLGGVAFGVLLGVATRIYVMRNEPHADEDFATPWMVRGIVLWIVALFVTFYAL